MRRKRGDIDFKLYHIKMVYDMNKGQRERKREKETDRQTDRQADRLTD